MKSPIKRRPKLTRWIVLGAVLLASLAAAVYFLIYKNPPFAFSPAVTYNCKSQKPPRQDLESSLVPQIKKLAEYETVCESNVVSGLSFFTSIPTTQTEAEELATQVTKNLYEYSKYSIKPIVILEPTTATGLIDMKKYQNGDYDSALDLYFSKIKEAGIDDDKMGVWVPFPEGNAPVWSNLEPDVFVDCFVKTVNMQKKYFPDSQASILLNNSTYYDSTNWNNGQIVSLLPYVNRIPVGLVNSFGLQGFPWMSPANETSVDNGTPNQYLNVNLAEEAAVKLGVKEIWFNTGTFESKYVNTPEAKITIEPSIRLSLLEKVVEEAKYLKNKTFDVNVHLFAQDKSQNEEATNWSYWKQDEYNTSPSANVLRAFVGNLQSNNIGFWLYDS